MKKLSKTTKESLEELEVDDQNFDFKTESKYKRSFEDRKNDQALKHEGQNQKLRFIFASAVFVFMVAYMWFVCYCLMIKLNEGELSDTVLVTLLGTTTVTVISLFAFVMKFLFNTGAKDDSLKM